MFHFGKNVYALDNREPGSRAKSRGILAMRRGNRSVMSPLYKQRIRLRDGCRWRMATVGRRLAGKN
ncbi:nitrite reductase (NAD(P)H) small subunit [Enterobacter hormaechei]